MTRLPLAAAFVMLTAIVATQESTTFLTIERAGRRIPVARYTGGKWIRSCAPAGTPAMRVTPLPADAPERADLVGPIREVFAERQREQRVAAANLDDVPMTIDWVYRYAAPGEPPIYYFEASKWKADSDGALRVIVSGWLMRQRGPLVPMASKGELRWEEIGAVDAIHMPELLPLGVARSGPQEIWIMEARTGASASMVLYDVRPGAAALLLRTEPC